MKRFAFISCLLIGLAGCTAPAPPPPPPAPPSSAVTDSLKTPYEAMKGYITTSLEQIPEDRFSFQPTKEVRTIGQLFGHIADGNYLFCSASSGEAAPSASVEKSMTSKAALQQAVAESFAFCDRAFAALNDQTGAAEATIVPINNMKTTKLGALSFNTAHDAEHYGNLVTYMRMNKMVPPSSQGGGM
jgi:uncharacterized damage-inducible protein DinB